MKKERRSFDKEFKMMAVNLCSTGKPSKEVAEELGIRAELVRRWNREYSQSKEGSFSGQGKAKLSDVERENLRLQKALREAELERDILKKAVSIFSKTDIKYTSS